MGLLQPIGKGQGYLKAGFLGFNKSGKTHTATELAIGVRGFFKLEGPIAVFDTEGGSEYIADRVRKATGKELLGLKSRSLDDLIAMTRECVAGGVSVLLVDSVTHIWRELCDAALQQINGRLRKAGKLARRSLEMQDWGPIKSKWSQWTDLYLNAPLHIVICGRAGYEFDHEADENGKRQLIKTGVKMKTEGEFGFEPSLLVEMERVQVLEPKHRIIHRATVLGDRFGEIDGKQADDPTWKFFRPHVARLVPGAHTPIDTEAKTDVGLDEDGNDDWHREKRQRAIFAEEIQGELARAYPAQTNEQKQARGDLLERHFGTRSWTKISEATHSSALKRGLDELRVELRPPAPPAPDDNQMPTWGDPPAPAATT